MMSNAGKVNGDFCARDKSELNLKSLSTNTNHSQPMNTINTVSDEMDKQVNCEQCALLISKINVLSEENLKLKALTRDMNEIDRRRQTYDLERQDYIQRLLKTIKMLQLRSSRLITGDRADQSFDSLVPADQTNGSPIRARKERCESDADECRSTLTAIKQSYECVVKENVRLRKELEELCDNFDKLVDQLGTIESEHIDALVRSKRQREECETERKEKECALSELTRLNQVVRSLNDRCEHYERRLNGRCETLDSQRVSSSQARLAARKCNSLPKHYRHSLERISDDKCGVNSLHNHFVESAEKCRIAYAIDGECGDRSDELKFVECPNCQLAFPVQCQTQFLQHFELCQTVN